MGRTHRLAGLAGGTVAALGLAAVVLGTAGTPNANNSHPALLFPVAYQQPQSKPQPEAPPEAPAKTATQPENPGEMVVVFLRDGRRLEGRLITRDNAKVVLEIAGFPTTFNMANVLRIDPVPPVADRYRQLRAIIADDDIEQLLLLTDWLRDREAFSLALVEVAHILRLDPDNEQARALKQQIESTILLRAESMSRIKDAEPGSDHAPRTRPRQRPDFPTLTRDQINLIKIYEVDLKDPPRLSVDRDTIRRLVEAYDGHDLIPQSREGRAALERRPPVYILELMFRLRAREFYNEVRVGGEPKAFSLFRENVHRPWLVPTCSSTACHGGQQSGNLWLKNTSPNNEQTIYTNFLILDRYRLADDTPLINYTEPAKSPLLQMALPRDVSLYPHPLVATSSTSVWRPVIGSTDDLRFAKAIQWINAMYQPRPEYPVTYEPPKPTLGVPVLPDDPIGER
ncbi:MAG: hypothetical protein Q9O74_11940 [Planctomycetota bacterium]|nr:hypothetical protein [Planctomycetota bacterium]